MKWDHRTERNSIQINQVRFQHQYTIAKSPNAKGMTILELAVATVLIGIVFLLAFRGSAMIENMRAIAVSYELQQFQRFVLAYQVEWNNLPGDDDLAAGRWGREPALTWITDELLASLERNGRIDGKLFDISNPDSETFTAWRDLRLAGMIEGGPQLKGLSALPENPFGGFYAFDQGNLGRSGGSLCATRIPGRAAKKIDDAIDDGFIDRGDMVATSQFSVEQYNHFEAPDSEPYDFEKEYIICVPILP